MFTLGGGASSKNVLQTLQSKLRTSLHVKQQNMGKPITLSVIIVVLWQTLKLKRETYRGKYHINREIVQREDVAVIKIA